MVRINEFGEIIRDSPPTSQPRRTTPPSPPPPPVQPDPDRPGSVILGTVIVGLVVFGILGAIAGYGAGSSWFTTEPMSPERWSKGIGSFFHCLFLASWSPQSVHHAIQDATIPLRVLLTTVTGGTIALLIAGWHNQRSASGNEGTLILGLTLGAFVVMVLTNAVVRLLVYLLSAPVTWFVSEIHSPWLGMFAVGICWAVLGAGIGLVAGIILAFSE